MTEGEEWAEAVTADLETLQDRLAERRDQRSRQLAESVDRVRTDLEEVQGVVRETDALEERLRNKRRRRSNRRPGTETWQRLDREITELEQELWQMRRWAADRRRDIKRELEEMRHNLEDAEFSEKILE